MKEEQVAEFYRILFSSKLNVTQVVEAKGARAQSH